MGQSRTSSEVNKKVCEAAGCFAEATISIKVNLDQQRTITLDLCKGCVNQFQDAKAEEASTSNSYHEVVTIVEENTATTARSGS